jgi:exosortase
VLQLPTQNLEVVEACSGSRSLVSLMMVAAILNDQRGARGWQALVMIAAVVPITIAANAVRVAGTGLASSWFGPEAAEGFFHTFTGFVMFATALAALYGVARLSAWAARGLKPAVAAERPLP